MSKQTEIIKELEQLANEKSDDYYHADCLEEQQDLAEKALLIIKQLQKEVEKYKNAFEQSAEANKSFYNNFKENIENENN